MKDDTRKEDLFRETNDVTFTIEELGLSNRQVWAATLGELARRGDVGRTELELAAAGRVDRSRWGDADPGRAERGEPGPHRDALLPAVREALAATIGARVSVRVVVEGERRVG